MALAQTAEHLPAPVIDIHAHYVSPDLVDEAARHGTRYGVTVSRDADDNAVLKIADTPPLRPIFPVDPSPADARSTRYRSPGHFNLD
jgi:hypothetical protein